MPASFGRQPGPRQRLDSLDRHRNDVGEVHMTWVAIEADGDQLQSLLPEDFELGQPLLVIEASRLAGIPWLAGRGYNLIMVTVPVVFVREGRRTAGRLELVTWENFADAIVSGRDELGFNKVYAEISHSEDTALRRSRWSASWDGTRFLDLEVTTDDRASVPATWREGPVFHHRVLPRTGEWGAFEVDQITANTATETEMTVRSAAAGSGGVRFHPATFEQLPTLVHVVNTLATLRLGTTIDAGTMSLDGWSDGADMRILAARTVPSPVEYDFG